MSDVPSAALWTLALALVLAPARQSAIDAGAACALAILVRPNLAPLAAFMAAWLLANDLQRGAGAETRTVFSRLVGGRALPFAALAAGGAIVTAVINWKWYGGATDSGYGDLGALFAFAHVPVNAANYFGWLVEAESPLALAGFAAMIVAPYWVNRRRDLTGVPVLLWLFVAWIWGGYFLYRPFEWWWYLRFLLPTWPLMAIGSASLIVWLWNRRGVWRAVAAGISVAAISATLSFAWRHDAFHIGLTESRYPQVARGVAQLTDAESGILTLQHSGSVRYYGGRMTLRWDLVEPNAFGVLLAWMRSHGHHPYLLVDAGELPKFRARFAGNPALTVTEWPPLAAFFKDETLLFDLNATGPALPTRLGVYTRRAIQPAAPAGWLLRVR
jgi:hypothetical protein